MSKEVDTRVVEMEFDNKQFEQNVSTSMSTIDKLKKSLNFDGASKSLSDVSQAASTVNFNPLLSAVDTVRVRFSLLDSFVNETFHRIASYAVDTGKKVVSAFTVEPVKAGFSEYELKMQSVQTIMMSTGEDIKTVNKYLDELNKYSDDTIYSFQDMTTSIGKFTNNGVKLEDAVAAIKGISNEAAVSGANAQEASRAMYNFSQALSSGYVKLIDWKSIENANMATVEFKNQLLESAAAAGTLEKQVDGMYKIVGTDEVVSATYNFNDSLQKQWMTSEVLINTLGQYADETTDIGKKAKAAATEIKTFSMMMDTLKEAAQSGWAQSFEIIFGDLEEAKKLWTSVGTYFGDIIGKISDARNALLKSWDILGGREALFEGIKNIFSALSNIVVNLKQAFNDIFPKTTGHQLADASKKFRDFTASLTSFGSILSSIPFYSIFKAFFSLLDIGWHAVKAVANGVMELASALVPAGKGAFDLVGSFSDLIIKFHDFIIESDIFNKVIGTIVTVILNFYDIASAIFIKLKDKFTEFINIIKEDFKFPTLDDISTVFGNIYDRILSIIGVTTKMKDSVVDSLNGIDNAVAGCSFLSFLSSVWDLATKLAGGIFKTIYNFISDILTKLGKGDYKGILDLINTLSIGSIAGGITGFLKSLDGTVEGITGILDSVRGCFEAYQQSLKAEVLKKIAVSIAILTASIFVISTIDSEKLTDSLTAIGIMFAELIAATAMFNKITDFKKGLGKATVVMIGMATAVLILSGAVKSMSELSWKDLAKGLTGVLALLASVTLAAKYLAGSKHMMKGATGLIFMAAAIKILASACKDFATMSWEELAKGLVSVTALIAVLSLFLNNTKFSMKTGFAATGLVLLAASLKILASVCKDFATMSWKDIAKGLASVTALMAVMSLFTNVTGHAKHVVSTGLSMIALAAAMKILASACKDFAAMSWVELGKGMAAMAVGLTEIVIAMRLMPKNAVSIGIGLIAVSTSLMILAKVMNTIGQMSIGDLVKSLTAIGVALTEFAVALNFMKGTAGGSAALLIASVALGALVPSLVILGMMKWSSIAKGLIAMAGAFTIFGVAGKVLKPLIPTLMKLSASFALLGVGVLALGLGLVAIGAGITSVSVALASLGASLTVVVAEFVASATIILGGIIALIPSIVRTILTLIVEIAKQLAENADTIGEAILETLIAALKVIKKGVPEIIDAIFEVVIKVMDSLIKYVPDIVDRVVDFIIVVLDKLGDRIPDIVKAVLKFVSKLFVGIANAMNEMNPEMMETALLGIGVLTTLVLGLNVIKDAIPGAMSAAVEASLLIAEVGAIIAAFGAINQIPGLEWIIGEGGDLLEVIGEAIGKFAGGLIGGVAEGIFDQLPDIGKDLSDFMINMDPFFEGAKKIDEQSMHAVNLMSDAILKICSSEIIDAVAGWFMGDNDMSKFAEDLVPFGEAMCEFAETVKDLDKDAAEKGALAGKMLVGMAQELPNSGGVLGWIMGENDMNEFGEQLIPFGEAVCEFADIVKDIDVSSVDSAAYAGKMMAQMAQELPNTGGVAGWFLGDNDMDEFGDQLVSFGTAVKEFTTSIIGIDVSSVDEAATAGSMMAKMAETLPNTGGVVGFFAGDNDMDEFGKQLIPFGTAIKSFADTVKDIDVKGVEGAASAGSMMASLSETLPNTGGVVGFFAGDKDFNSFSTGITMFGIAIHDFSAYASVTDGPKCIEAAQALQAIATAISQIPLWDTLQVAQRIGTLPDIGSCLYQFYANTSSINIETMSSVCDQLKKIAEALVALKDVDANAISIFTTLASSGIESFVDTFTNANDRVKSAIATFVTYIVSAVNSKKPDLIAAVNDVSLEVINQLYELDKSFTDNGTIMMDNLKTSISNKESSVRLAVSKIIKAMITVFTNNSKNFYTAGSNLVVGFINGINDNIQKAAKKAAEMAKAALDAATKVLDEHSPSKAAYQIGDYFGIGFVNGIDNNLQNSYKISEQMASSAKKGLADSLGKINDYLNGNIDTQPTIRPILDLSDIESGSRMLGSMLNNDIVNLGEDIKLRNVKFEGSSENNQNGVNGNEQSLTFVQNNYSPKHLSSIDIYRQTRNQLSSLKGALG